MKTTLPLITTLTALVLSLFWTADSAAQLNWVKYEDYPVLEGIPGTWCENLWSPVVIHDQGLFKMWFMGEDYDQTIWQIGYADSPDGITWNIYDDPAIPAGQPITWDYMRCPGTVLRINDTLKMWWVGSPDIWSAMRIFYAWSVEEYEWNILPDPVLEMGEPGLWDDWSVTYPQVYYDGTMYHMYYSGIGGPPGIDIGYATSANGIDWDRSFFNPVLSHSIFPSFYNQWITPHGLIVYDDTIRMFFNGMNSDWTHFRVGYAWSAEYVFWSIENDSEPVVDLGEPGAWDDEWVRMPTVLVHNGQLKMWYTGKQAGNPSLKIGYALGDLITGLSDNDEPCCNVFSVSPCPFTNQVTLSYQVREKSMVQLDLYNLSGQLVSAIVSEVKEQGNHEVVFNGEYLQPGVYFCVLKTSDPGYPGQTKKLIKL